MKKNLRKYFHNLSKRLHLKHFIYATLVIVAASVFLFLVSQQQRKIVLYATGVMGSNDDIFVAVPYWVANNINKGDKEKSLTGEILAEVTDKVTYEGGSHGKHVIVKLKISAQEDKNGKYYYKNQPLEVNKWFDLRLGKINEKIYLINLSNKTRPQNERKIRITVKKPQEFQYIADSLTVGDEMRDNKGVVMAKIVNKSETPAEIRYFSPNGQLNISHDMNTKDLLLTVDVTANSQDGIDYFGEIRKVKIGEKLNLFFNKATLWDAIIVSVDEIRN